MYYRVYWDWSKICVATREFLIISLFLIPVPLLFLSLFFSSVSYHLFSLIPYPLQHPPKKRKWLCSLVIFEVLFYSSGSNICLFERILRFYRDFEMKFSCHCKGDPEFFSAKLTWPLGRQILLFF